MTQPEQAVLLWRALVPAARDLVNRFIGFVIGVLLTCWFQARSETVKGEFEIAARQLEHEEKGERWKTWRVFRDLFLSRGRKRKAAVR